MDDDEARETLIDLSARYGREIPPDVLAQHGVSPAQYAGWRMDLADEDDDARRAIASAVAADDQHAKIRALGLPPILPTRSPEEVAAVDETVEQMEARTQRARELEGKARWLDPDEEI